MKIFRIIISVLFALLLSVPLTHVTHAHTFSDVSSNFWAHNQIEWAASERIVGGYNDGTFKPNDTFTEAQFAAVLANYFNVHPLNIAGDNHWAQGIYRSLGGYGLPLRGYNNDSVKNRPVKRGTIARVLAATQGHPDDIHSAVDFMYDNNISTGRNGIKTYESYGIQETLTRAQAAVFFKNLSDNDIKEIKADGTRMQPIDMEYYSGHVYADFEDGLTVQVSPVQYNYVYDFKYVLVGIYNNNEENKNLRVENLEMLGYNSLTNRYHEEITFNSYPLTEFNDLTIQDPSFSLAPYSSKSGIVLMNNTENINYFIYSDNNRYAQIEIPRY